MIGTILLFLTTYMIPTIAQNTGKQLSSRDNWLYVGGSGPGNYTKIQDAIDNASDGNIVFVYDDSSPYYENILITKSIRLIGEEKSTTYIDAQQNGTVVEIHADNVTITNFSLQHSGRDTNAGINLYGNNCNLSNNRITDNFYGIRIHYTNNNIIQDNELMNNNNDQIYLYCTNYTTIQHNRISRTDYFTIGICCFYCTGNTIRNNTVNKTYHGIYISGTTNSTIEANRVNDCFWKALMLSDAPDNIVRGNFLREPILLSQACDITLTNSPRCTVENNSLLSGVLIEGSYPERILNNLVQEKPLVYLDQKSDTFITIPCGQIILFHCRNITIQNQCIQQTVRAIHLECSNNCHLLNNTLCNNRQGIICSMSNFTSISKNVIDVNYDDGLSIDTSNNNKILDNTIENTIGCGLNVNGVNNTIDHNTISNSGYIGFVLTGQNISIINNTISGNNEGIRIRFLSNTIIKQNSMEQNTEYGISMSESTRNTIAENSFTGNGCGITLGIYCTKNTIRYNEFKENQDGVLLDVATENQVIKNNFINNKQHAFFHDAFYNNWFRNYWGQLKLIKIIWGTQTVGYGWTYNVLRIDWFPAQKPYDVSI